MKKVLVGMPNIGGIPPKTVASLMQLVRAMGFPQVMFIENSLIYDARNDLALEAINGGYDELLFIDSDLVFPADAYEKLEALDADIATGIYYGRAGEHKPIVYKSVSQMLYDNDMKIIPAKAEAFTEIPDGTFEVAGCGMGMCLIKVEVLKELVEVYEGTPFEPFRGLGEDLAFCWRATQQGYKIKANSYIPLGHIGTQVFTKGDYKGICVDR